MRFAHVSLEGLAFLVASIFSGHCIPFSSLSQGSLNSGGKELMETSILDWRVPRTISDCWSLCLSLSDGRRFSGNG